MGRGLEGVSNLLILLTEGKGKLIAIHAQPNYQIVHLFGFRKAHHAPHQPFDPVAYPVAADNVSGPLASRLSGVNQPVIRSRIGFLASR